MCACVCGCVFEWMGGAFLYSEGNSDNKTVVMVGKVVLVPLPEKLGVADYR